MTEKNPLMAQPHATYSELCSSSVATRVMASGMNMPRQKPSGAHSTTTTAALASVGHARSASTRRGATNA